MVEPGLRNTIKNLLDDIYKEYKTGSSYKGDPLFNIECERLVDLITRDRNVDNIYNLISQLDLTEEQFTALGYRIESIYVRINNFNDQVRLDNMLRDLAQKLYPKSIVFWKVIFKRCAN